jgi:hypothetical protein
MPESSNAAAEAQYPPSSVQYSPAQRQQQCPCSGKKNTIRGRGCVAQASHTAGSELLWQAALDPARSLPAVDADVELVRPNRSPSPTRYSTAA